MYLGISQRVSGMNCGVALSLALLTAVLPTTAARPLCLCRHAAKYHARPGHYECYIRISAMFGTKKAPRRYYVTTYVESSYVTSK